MPSACEDPFHDHHQCQSCGSDPAGLKEHDAETGTPERQAGCEATDYECGKARKPKQYVEWRKCSAKASSRPRLWLHTVNVHCHMLIAASLIHTPLILGLGMHLPPRTFFVAHRWFLLKL
ncbi:hypothetical protein [Streptomyces sp. NPDC090445]|uniref:hypothetical protein n=1 Tax=Streptomyces sp. NPDC090445 TaxID=3365963 RepID=UPI0038303842